ncbi:MAG: carboxypeptidase-like regulatory domain-containing protein, partial [Terriglobales bacterium]
MKRNVLLAMAVAIAGLGVIGLTWAQDDEGPTSSLKFVVVRDTDGKPVRNAEVVLHPVKRKGKQDKGELDLKTDADGKTSMDGVPYGPLRVQVLAPHFQTFGEDYEVDKPELEITVKLKHPGGQYSVYDN